MNSFDTQLHSDEFAADYEAVKAVERARRANISSVEKAETLVAKYREQLSADRSEKNRRLASWADSILLGVKILNGEVRMWDDKA